MISSVLPSPPRPIGFIPKGINLKEYILQPKYRGWRIVVLDNKVYTRHQNYLNITTNFRTDFDYMLDGEIISQDYPSAEYKVPRAIRENKYELKIFDIYVFDKPDMILLDRLQFLNKEFGIKVSYYEINDTLENLVYKFQKAGYEGIVLKKKDGKYLYGEGIPMIDSTWIKLK